MTDPDAPHDQLQRRPTQWYDCSGFQRDLLLAITLTRLDECPYGMALHEWLDARYPVAFHPPRVYSNLGDLTDAGLIERDGISDRTIAYRLTETGRACLAAHGQFVNALELPGLAPTTAPE